MEFVVFPLQMIFDRDLPRALVTKELAMQDIQLYIQLYMHLDMLLMQLAIVVMVMLGRLDLIYIILTL